MDENGDILQVRNSSGKMVDYSDWWTGYIGQAKMHFFRGFRTATPVSGVSQWGSL
ncbi:MAG: hypothetical protein J6U47_02700 [Bacteroidales bacterium]|nr:hypothetical protein [Bacteroidales bacterium]